MLHFAGAILTQIQGPLHIPQVAAESHDIRSDIIEPPHHGGVTTQIHDRTRTDNDLRRGPHARKVGGKVPGGQGYVLLGVDVIV